MAVDVGKNLEWSSFSSRKEDELDVFISHSSSEKSVARELKKELKSCGLKVFIYEDDVPCGSSIPTSIANAIYRSRRCVMIVSVDFLGSDYFIAEYTWARQRQNELGIVSCIPVLFQLDIEDLPADIGIRDINCLKYNDDQFKQKLHKAITENISIRSQIAVTQTGVGLAWSYFYGFLNIILPGLEDRVKNCSEFKFPVYPKQIIILPVSCRCPEVMPETEKFRHVGFINYKVSRAANQNRCYKSTVYDFAFTSKDNQKVHCHLLMEFATPLLSLYQMYDGNIAQLTKDQMRNERHTFKDVVEQILNNSSMKECHGKYLLVDYRDEDEQTTSHKWKAATLGEVVAKAVENDMIASNCTDKYLVPSRE